jgi:hypothetical protein
MSFSNPVGPGELSFSSLALFSVDPALVSVDPAHDVVSCAADTSLCMQQLSSELQSAVAKVSTSSTSLGS